MENLPGIQADAWRTCSQAWAKILNAVNQEMCLSSIWVSVIIGHPLGSKLSAEARARDPY